MIQEFKAFVNQGNAIDLAVGVVIGAAFGKIVNSMVNDIIMPLVGGLIGQVDFQAAVRRAEWQVLSEHRGRARRKGTRARVRRVHQHHRGVLHRRFFHLPGGEADQPLAWNSAGQGVKGTGNAHHGVGWFNGGRGMRARWRRARGPTEDLLGRRGARRAGRASGRRTLLTVAERTDYTRTMSSLQYIEFITALQAARARTSTS